VFKCRRVLYNDYIPPRLPHRDGEMEELLGYFRPVILQGGSARVHVYGPIGTGKTVLCKSLGKRIVDEAEEEAGLEVRYIYLNLAYMLSPYQVLTQLMNKLSLIQSSSSGLSTNTMLLNLVRFLETHETHLILGLDEADKYVKEGGDTELFYLLSRIHELGPLEGKSNLSLIYISRKLEWLGCLEPATLDTVGRASGVHLEDYSYAELSDILRYRADEAFHDGAASFEIIDFASSIAESYGGIRYALELLLEAGMLADADNSSKLRPVDVRRAHVKIPKGVNGAYYPSELILHKQLLILGSIRALDAGSEAYVSYEAVYEYYCILCDEYQREPEDLETFIVYIGDLEEEGYLLTKRGSALGVEFPLTRMRGSIEKVLERALTY